MMDRAEKGLEMLGNDIYEYLHGKKEQTEIKTTESDGKIVNIINNYGNTTPSVKYSFVRTGIMIIFMTALVVGTYMILTNPHAIVDFGNWLRTLFGI